MKKHFDRKQAMEELQKGYHKADRLLKDDAKMESFLEKLEKRVKWIPFIRKELKSVPILISMVRSYWKRDYRRVPRRTIVAIVSALIYFLSPIDFIPDWIPFLGQLDDALVVGTCWNLVYKDIEDYRQWKKARQVLSN
ncbi:YkvA family protein [Streptococcus pseudoporcinus]|uniref:Membrane protein n=1 Tax=Streptococcus pseudoporcinus TaxID=361101 RepID=A0A4U9XR22_9STRE|nr:YkvA family protein [Streptococcus pseudoporcinus]VTS15298.1 membrane protein [Streptococcus pseudoporcinus]VUC67560.1 membrane protein [Streptococcus pseudoporcinus]VUC98487.1 membrane protein [Streptococcus pseudoporcinus]VUC98877.1 membrane protein [Streptococcus pseudoporcinus]